MDTTRTVPNHHAAHRGFHGVTGLVAALSMLVGRGGATRLALDLAHLEPGDRVVDLGCGPGTAARAAARRGAAVVGVDPAHVMLAVARVVPRGAGIRWVEGTAESSGLEPASATVVWSLSTVHHWADVDRALDEVRRLLLPGGRFVAIERRSEPGATGHASHGWTLDQAGTFADQLIRHGFDAVHVSTHRVGHGVVVAVVAGAPDRPAPTMASDGL